MSVLRINGGRPLKGTVRVHGSKNGILPIMAASIISRGETKIHNCPSLSDVDAAIKILRHLGCRAEKIDDTVYIDSSTMSRCDIPDSLMREMRSSVIFLGAILVRSGEAVLSMPGGCELGPRPIDLHLSSMRSMGAVIDERGGNLICHAPKLKECRIDLAFPSVGATENSIIAAAGCSGTTVITNAAREPEIRDLVVYLKELGVSISGEGSSVIVVNGAKFKPYTEHTIIPDRIVACTYLAAAAASRGKITVTGVLPDDFRAVTDVFSQMGCKISVGSEDVTLDARDGLRAPKTIITKPYPGFPTDVQPPLMAASLVATGTTVFVETMFESRYRHVSELMRMGADIHTDGRVAIVNGVERLHGATVESTDLRGGAALVVAGIAAHGITEIHGLHHIDRGYDNLENALTSLGADCVRCQE